MITRRQGRFERRRRFMDIILNSAHATRVSADVLAVGVFSDQLEGGLLTELDQALDGAIQAAIAADEFRGRWLQTWSNLTLGKLPARRILLIGLGPSEAFTGRELRMMAGQAGMSADQWKAKTLAIQLPSIDLTPEDAAASLTEGVLLGCWQFATYKSEPPKQWLEQVWLLGLAGEDAEAGLARGRVIAQAQNLTRELGARPSNYLYPAKLAEAAVEAGQQHGFDAEVFDEARLAEMGMGCLLGVGQGSAYPPRLVVMRYEGKPGGPTLALVGKGITFDSGGISLKSAPGMEDMKYDMLGAAAVLGALVAIADLALPINVVGLMAVAQNIPSGTSYKPGDVLKAFNGKTIEITNTDAEGRVALADAVSYAAHLGVNWIVETSTLTGAVMVALGHEATALVSQDDALAALVLQSAESAGERVWRLPTYPEFRKLYRSDIADIKNAPGRDAGTITGGMIIAEFAGTVPFAHLDIAGTAWTDRGPLNRVKNSPTGVMVRTFVELAGRLSQ